MSHLQFVDELVREYLLFRGFSGALKSFDGDLKVDKDKGFRVDKIVDQLVQCVYNYDLTGLRESWGHLDARLFSRLDHHFTAAIKKLENGVLKFYLVYASENNKTEKITEFFQKMTAELVGQNEWKDWFVLPFIKNPEENALFSVYFSRQWQDTLLVSLHNFLAAVYQCMPLPTIANYEESASKMMNLQKENEMLRKGLANMIAAQEDGNSKALDPVHSMDLLIDDFYNISQEIRTTESQTKILKSLMRNLSVSNVVPSSPKLSDRSLSQPTATAGRTDTKKHVSKKVQVPKRSVSTDARPGGSGGSNNSRHKERDSSLDVGVARTSKRDEPDKTQEPGFLFLSQEEYNEHKAEVTAIKFNARGSSVASADVEGNLKVWTVGPVCRTGCSLSVGSALTCLDWMPNERYIACGAVDGRVRLLDIKEKQEAVDVDCCPTGARIDDVACTSDSSFVTISGGKVFLIDLKTKSELTLSTGTSHALCCSLHQNGSMLLVGCEDGGLQVVDIRRNEVVDSTLLGSGQVRQVQFTLDFAACYAIATDNRLYHIPLPLSKEKPQVFCLPVELPKPSSHGRLFCLNSTGAFLLAAGTNSGIIYKIHDKTLVKSLELGGHKSRLTCVDWSFANQCGTCITTSQDGRVRISTLLVDII